MIFASLSFSVECLSLKAFAMSPLQAETSLTENITNQDSYFRAVTFQPLKAEGGDDETQYDDSNDSYTTYSYEYESSEDYSDPKKDTTSDKKLFRSSKIKLGKGSYKAKNSDKRLFSSSKIVIGKGSGGKGKKTLCHRSSDEDRGAPDRQSGP